MDKVKSTFAQSIADPKKVRKSVKLTRDSSNTAKVSLVKIKAAGVNLEKPAAASRDALAKAKLLGIRGKFICLLDYSYSMSTDYRSGRVQKLTERGLTFGLQFASDERALIIPFDDHAKTPVVATLDNYDGIVSREIDNGNMGSTNLADGLRKVKKIAEESDELIYLQIVTDGDPNPDTKQATTDLVCELAGYPVFIKFLALRDVPYLQMLDDLPDTHRLLDNVDAKFFPSLEAITDEAFADAMVDEWESWLELATAAGVLTN